MLTEEKTYVYNYIKQPVKFRSLLQASSKNFNILNSYNNNGIFLVILALMLISTKKNYATHFLLVLT